ncbi:MAG: UDP-N-acetylglucosamine 1-carboxyvinyltransferase [Candidatus Marinimicrobia bacterium]|nr:UDP-N-acetylglucosamine 1-carboxyvinyltransferase [Candidatus Neomarinimicrobiota bacterium]
MDKFIIHGGKSLKGEVSISGAKNAALPIMAATIIEPGEYILHNIPNLRDTLTMKRLLEMIGATVNYNNNTMEINTVDCDTPIAPYELVKTMRASFYVLGPFMSRFGEAQVSLPGGCAWGPRPVDFHLKALEQMGASVTLSDGMIHAKGKLAGVHIHFDKSSVGATGNVVMAAVYAEGITTISNAAMEPEIVALCDFLTDLGTDINGIGTDTLAIKGGNKLQNGVEFNNIPDRIEAGTFLLAGAITNGEITLLNADPDHLKVVIDSLKQAGVTIETGRDWVKVTNPSKKINPVNMVTAVYPGFPTDLQAQWIALMTRADGHSIIIDDIYTDRFTHLAELSRFGAHIQLTQNRAEIYGIDKLRGAPVMSTDIRASASLILAALAAEGKSEISRIYHIDRGYENIETKLKAIRADIDRVKA